MNKLLKNKLAIAFVFAVAWYGPVLTPCLVSLSMILLALVILYFEPKGALCSLRKREWGTMLIGCFIILFTFMWPFFQHAGWAGGHWHWPGSQQLVKAGLSFVPDNYNWVLFVAGYAVIIIAITVYAHRLKNSNKILY